MCKIPEFLSKGRNEPTSPSYEKFLKNFNEYEKRFGEIDWDDFSVPNMATEEELGEAIEYCLKTGKRMPEVRPEWCEPCPEDCLL